MELVNSARNRFTGGKACAHWVRLSQIVRLSARTHDERERVVPMRSEIGNGDAVCRRDVLDVIVVGIDVLHLEGVVFAARWVPG